MKQCLLFILSFSLIKNLALCQTIIKKSETELPEIGKPCPDFLLNDIQYYSEKQVSLDDFKGKWLVLDFWNKGCAICIQSFPKVSKLQAEFSNNVKWIMIGGTGSQYGKSADKQTRQLYEKKRTELDLNLTVAYDSILFRRFGIQACPVVIVVNPKGNVEAITWEITRDNILDLLNGKSTKFPKAYDWIESNSRITYNADYPLLLNGNGGADSDFIYRSILSEIRDFQPIDKAFALKDNNLNVLGVNLLELYRFAYLGIAIRPICIGDSFYGRVAYHPHLRVKDSSLFQSNLDYREGLYCYSVTLPKNKCGKKDFMDFLQKDLKKFFGYDAKIETVMQPVWKLVKLKPKIDAYNFDSNLGHDISEYSSPEDLLKMICVQFPNVAFPLINGLSDGHQTKIKVAGLGAANWERVNRSLNVSGYYFIKDEKEMKVLVIKDPKDEN